MVSTMKRLEEFVNEMASRSENMNLDITEQLQQQERALILAAEFGNDLLDRNEKLIIQNEQIAVDFSHQLEVLEQEKYRLSRRLETSLSDYDIRVSELEADISELRKSLEDQQRLLRQTEREKSSMIVELTEQNQRLTSQLSKAVKNEETLNHQLQTLRDQFSLRKVALSDHVNHLENLREEIAIITSEKVELERKIHLLLAEKDGISSTLEDSSDRISFLERQSREQEMQLIGRGHEMDEMRITNQSLLARLELLNRSAAVVNRSLLNELELSPDFRTTSGLSAASSGIGVEEDDIECDEGMSSQGDMKQLKEEVWLAYCSILAMCHQLKALKSKSQDSCFSLENSINSGTPFHFKPGLLRSTLEELKSLLRNLSSVEAMEENGNFKSQIELEMRLHSVEESLDKTEKNLTDRTDENKRLKDQVNQLTSQLTIREAELTAVTEERDNARKDMSETHLAKDEIVKRAWELRDKAVERKNKAEIEVARTRIDMMQGNSQLIEAVQQKIQLSQQLEQWQVDMQQLLDEQMRTKLSNQEVKEKPVVVPDTLTSTSQFERKRNKLFAIFRNFNS